MSERGNFRGRGGSGRGGGGEHSRGGRGGGGRGGGGQHTEKPKKENILDLARYTDKEITVKFNGGREGPWFLSCFLVLLFRGGSDAEMVGGCFSGRDIEGLRSAHEFGAG